MRTWLIFASFLAVLLAGCGGIPVAQDYDQAVDFTRYRSYAWQGESAATTGDPRLDNPLTHERLHAAIEQELAGHGYTKAAPGTSADFFVAYQLSVRQRSDYSGSSVSIGGGVFRSGGAYGIGVGIPVDGPREYDEGMLVINLIDATSKRMFWRGSSTRRITELKTPDERTAVIQETVRAILAQYPPK